MRSEICLEILKNEKACVYVGVTEEIRYTEG